MKKTIISLFSLIALFPTNSKAQGCSDAGVCTAGHITSGKLQSAPTLKLGAIFSQGENNISYVDFEANYSHPLDSINSLQIKVPYRLISGDLGNVNGLSDITLSWSRAWRRDKDWKISTVFGFRIPTSDANTEIDGNPLPMGYQTSLGTFDILAGLSARNKTFITSLAYQFPLNKNNNQYVAPIGETTPVFASTRNFDRAPDLVVRVGQVFDKPMNKWHFSYSLLTIIHTQDDTYEAVSTEGDVQLPLTDSRGFTTNITGSVSYALNEKNRLEFEFGSPIAITTSRPDGLIRLMVAGLRWSTRF